MTIDIIELDQLLRILIEDSRVPQEYSERLKRLKASIDPSGRFNLSRDPIWVRDESEPIARGALESDTIAHAVDGLAQGLYVGLRDAHLRTNPDTSVEYKRPADSEGGHAD